MIENSLEYKAFVFAEEKHRGQKRKYYDAPYIVHPVRVALIAKGLYEKYASISQDIVPAAFLHDVIEDCGVSRQEISSLFGESIANIVSGMTLISKINPLYKKLNRRERHAIDMQFLAEQSEDVITLKGIDRYANLLDSNLDNAECVGFFLRRYLKESMDIRNILRIRYEKVRWPVIDIVAYFLDTQIQIISKTLDWQGYES